MKGNWVLQQKLRNTGISINPWLGLSGFTCGTLPTEELERSNSSRLLVNLPQETVMTQALHTRESSQMGWVKQTPYPNVEEERVGQEGAPHSCQFFCKPNCHASHCGPVRSEQTGQNLFVMPTLSFRRTLFGMLRLELLWLILNSCCYWQPRPFSYLSLHFLISDNSLSSSSHRSLPCFSKALRKYFPCRSVCIRQKSHL